MFNWANLFETQVAIEKDKRLAMEIKRVMGDAGASSDGCMAWFDSTTPAKITTPLNGGIRQVDEAAALSRLNSTSRESLPNSCGRSEGDALARSATIAPDAVKTFGGVSPTIITEPVAAENNKQRER